MVSLFLRMPIVATVTVALFIIMSMADAYEARRILHGHAPPSTFNPKAMEYSQSRRYPPYVLVPPSAPIPDTHIPSSSWRQTQSPPHPFAGDHNSVSSSLGGTQHPPHVPVPPSAPNPGTHIPSSSWRQRKSPPHPFAGDHNSVSSSLGRTQHPPHVPVPPSAPNPGTHIPSSSWRQRKNPPHPYMLHGAYYQGTHIPAASTTSTTATMLGTP